VGGAHCAGKKEIADSSLRLGMTWCAAADTPGRRSRTIDTLVRVVSQIDTLVQVM
jgi:hypothetical protein